MRRRDALKAGAALVAGAVVYALAAPFRSRKSGDGSAVSSEARNGFHEARYYVKSEKEAVNCELCFRECRIPGGAGGFCRNRVNEGGKLFNIVYNNPSALNVEPTEKEPMHHFLPGTDMLCIGTAGCNFRCRFCHNWHLSQRGLEDMHRRYTQTPEEIVQLAKRRGVPSISFTYNEPTVFYEYMYDISVEAHEEGLKTIFHSNGAMKPEPLRDILRYTDAVTVDLKSFTRDFYRDVCGAERDPVLETLKIIREEEVWLEVVNLVVPGHNDEAEEVRGMCRWIAAQLGRDTPFHFSRFMPSYRMTNISPTPVPTLEKCRGIALEEGLRHVSIGNVPGHEANSSFCPACGGIIIRRRHFTVSEINMENGSCAACGETIPGVWR